MDGESTPERPPAMSFVSKFTPQPPLASRPDPFAMSEIPRQWLEGPEWGFMLGANFVRLPKVPFLVGEAVKPLPPFDVTMPDGSVRHIIEDPSASPSIGESDD